MSTSIVHLKVFRMLNFHTYVMTVLEHTDRRGHPAIEVATVNEVGISDWSPISLPCASVAPPEN